MFKHENNTWLDLAQKIHGAPCQDNIRTPSADGQRDWPKGPLFCWTESGWGFQCRCWFVNCFVFDRSAPWTVETAQGFWIVFTCVYHIVFNEKDVLPRQLQFSPLVSAFFSHVALFSLSSSHRADADRVCSGWCRPHRPIHIIQHPSNESNDLEDLCYVHMYVVQHSQHQWSNIAVDTPRVDQVGSHGAGQAANGIVQNWAISEWPFYRSSIWNERDKLKYVWGVAQKCSVNPKYDVVLHVLHAHKGVPLLCPECPECPYERSCNLDWDPAFIPSLDRFRYPQWGTPSHQVSPSVTKSWIDPIPKEGFPGSTENTFGGRFFWEYRDITGGSSSSRAVPSAKQAVRWCVNPLPWKYHRRNPGLVLDLFQKGEQTYLMLEGWD